MKGSTNESCSSHVWHHGIHHCIDRVRSGFFSEAGAGRTEGGDPKTEEANTPGEEGSEYGMMEILGWGEWVGSSGHLTVLEIVGDFDPYRH